MDIILVPGFWLDASSWSEVIPALVSAGHRAHPLTLPGLEAAEAPRAGIGLREHIDAVVAAVDALDARVVRAIYVDAGPLGEGGVINDELPADGDDVPLPPWEGFEEADLVDLDERLRTAFRARAVPQPRAVAYDKQHLH